MRLTGAVLLLVLTAVRPGEAGTCPGCYRTWLQGTLQRFGFGTNQQRIANLAVGDLDHDGRADVVAANGNVFSLLANADGVFRRGPDLAAGNASQAVGLADMDGDGHLDVVAGGVGLGVTRGDGTGNFLPPSPMASASAPIADLAIAHFDDSIAMLDVVVVHGTNANLVSIYRGIAAGGLQFVTSFPSGGEWPLAVAAGDFDRDGRTDIAVANNTSNLTVFHNAGGDQFVPHSYPLAMAALDMLSADLDGDGDLDLAIAGAGTPLGSVIVFEGDGDGGFVPGPTLAASMLSYGIAAGDFDGDGDVDLALDQSPDHIHVAWRQADGQYLFESRLVSGGAASLAAGDFNRDGRPDLAVGMNGGVEFVRVDVGQQISWAAQYNLGPANRLVTRDFNEDGHADLFVCDGSFSRLWLGNGAFGVGNAGFEAPTCVTGVSDFNADGHLDIATFTRVFLGNGQGGFTQAAAFGGFAVADFNVDGKTDLVGYVGGSPTSGNITVRLGDGAGGFGPPIGTPITVPMFTITIDGVTGRFNGDAFPDVAYTTAGGSRLLLGNGAGGFNAAPFGGPPGQLVAGDFDGDGYSDTAVTTGFPDPISTVIVNRGGPAGLGAPSVVPLLSGGSHKLTVADADADGRDDILAINSASTKPDVTVLLSGSNGTFRRLGLATGGGGGDAVLADWDEDGRRDLALGIRTSSGSLVRFFAGSTCQAVALSLMAEPTSCNTPGLPFPGQPAVTARDAADNVVCPTGSVTATLLPGVDDPGAVLGGTTTEPFLRDMGIAAFTDLSIDLPGRGYRIDFASQGLVPVHTRTLSQGLAPSIAGSGYACPGRPERYEVAFGYDSYAWQLDSAFLLPGGAFKVLDLPLGPHTLGVSVLQDACFAVATRRITSVLPSVDVIVVGPTTVCPACTAGLFGANVIASESAPIQWGYRTQTGGSITSLPDQASPTYRLAGSDFPGPGTYLVVASVDCGTTAVSNEIPITVTVPLPAHEIAHGARVQDDLSPQPPAGAVRQYLLAQEARSSYEVVVEGTSGDIGARQGPLVEHVAGDGSTVLGAAAPVGAGPSRSLRIVNVGSSRVADLVRVTSASCGTDCGPDDVFTLRAYETTLRASRFNNAGTQTTVVLLQNSGNGTVQGEIHFWSPAGARLAGQPFLLGPRELFVLSVASLPQLAGGGGSITVSHDAPHGSLAGKAVAIEPSTGFSFDTPFTVRER